MKAHWLDLLDELRAIGQKGLYYATDPFEKERFERVLALTAQEYAAFTGIPEKEILNRFKGELGQITPKVGVDAAILNSKGEILLIQRSDDQCWGLPAGWMEVLESPEQSIVREVREETTLEVRVKDLIQIHTRLPGDFNQPHTTLHILYGCEIVSGTPQTTEEALQIGYFNPNSITQWHLDHAKFAQNALKFYG